MAYKTNKEFEELNRISDLNSKASLFLDNCMYVANQSCIPLSGGDREKFYSWTQLVLRELKKLEPDTLQDIFYSIHDINNTPDGLNKLTTEHPKVCRKPKILDLEIDAGTVDSYEDTAEYRDNYL